VIAGTTQPLRRTGAGRRVARLAVGRSGARAGLRADALAVDGRRWASRMTRTGMCAQPALRRAETRLRWPGPLVAEPRLLMLDEGRAAGLVRAPEMSPKWAEIIRGPARPGRRSCWSKHNMDFVMEPVRLAGGAGNFGQVIRAWARRARFANDSCRAARPTWVKGESTRRHRFGGDHGLTSPG